MSSPIVGGLLAFLAGTAVSALNYAINRRALRERPASLAQLSMVRQLLNLGCLAAAYFLARVLPWEPMPLLLGAALGLTIPSILLSLRLAKLNDAAPAPGEKNPPEKGDDPNA